MRTLLDPLILHLLSWHQLSLPPNEATSCKIIRFLRAFLQMLRHRGIINACHSKGDFILQRDASSNKTLIEGRMDDTMITIFRFRPTIGTWRPFLCLQPTRTKPPARHVPLQLLRPTRGCCVRARINQQRLANGDILYHVNCKWCHQLIQPHPKNWPTQPKHSIPAYCNIRPCPCPPYQCIHSQEHLP